MKKLESDLCIKLDSQNLVLSLKRIPEKFYPVTQENLKKVAIYPWLQVTRKRGIYKKLKCRLNWVFDLNLHHHRMLNSTIQNNLKFAGGEVGGGH